MSALSHCEMAHTHTHSTTSHHPINIITWKWSNFGCRRDVRPKFGIRIRFRFRFRFACLGFIFVCSDSRVGDHHADPASGSSGGRHRHADEPAGPLLVRFGWVVVGGGGMGGFGSYWNRFVSNWWFRWVLVKKHGWMDATWIWCGDRDENRTNDDGEMRCDGVEESGSSGSNKRLVTEHAAPSGCTLEQLRLAVAGTNLD